MTALIVAAARGNLALTEQLVELGANLDIRDPNNKRDAFVFFYLKLIFKIS